jgi:hypothetical protein
LRASTDPFVLRDLTREMIEDILYMTAQGGCTESGSIGGWLEGKGS